MATYWENSCSFGLLYVSWYKYLIVGLVFSPNKPFKYNMYFMMTYQHAKGFVGTRGGGGDNVQKIVSCFAIC